MERGPLPLTPGSTLYVIVGEAGDHEPTSADAAGGGGGTFVAAGATIYSSYVLSAPADGQITICVSRQSAGGIPTLSGAGLVSFIMILAALGAALVWKRH